MIVNILVEAFGGNAQLAKSVKYLSGQGTTMRRRCCCPYPRQRSSQRARSERELYEKILRRGFRFLTMFTGARSLGHFALFCFVSVHSTILSWIPCELASASFECWENSQRCASRNALAFQPLPPLHLHSTN